MELVFVVSGGTVGLDLLGKDHPHFLNGLEGLEAKVNGLVDGLILGIVVERQVFVLEGLLHGDSLVGVKLEQLFQQVNGLGIGIGEELQQGDLLLEGHVVNPLLGPFAGKKNI